MSEKRPPETIEADTETKGIQTIWGINPKDRIWFSIITITAGTAWGASIVVTTIGAPGAENHISDILSDTATGIAGAFATSGFGAWTILAIKDGIMGIGDYFRQKADKEARKNQEKGRIQGREEGRTQTIRSLMSQAEASGNQQLVDFIKQQEDTRM